MKLASEEESLLTEINVTPLVDVMLVLLIIFMVTAPLIQQGLSVNLPKSEAAQALAKEERDVILTITRNKSLQLENYTVKTENLKEKLAALYQNRQEKKIFIRSDSQVEYGYVIEIMGMIKAAGIDKIGMITDANAVSAVQQAKSRVR